MVTLKQPRVDLPPVATSQTRTLLGNAFSHGKHRIGWWQLVASCKSLGFSVIANRSRPGEDLAASGCEAPMETTSPLWHTLGGLRLSGPCTTRTHCSFPEAPLAYPERSANDDARGLEIRGWQASGRVANVFECFFFSLGGTEEDSYGFFTEASFDHF
jgi:hypothetical protein